AKEWCCACSGRHPADSRPSAGPAAALPVADAEFGEVSVIRVRGAKFCGHYLIRLRTSVLVFDPHGNGSAKGLALKNTRENLHPIGFFAGGDDFRLPWTTPIKIWLNIRFGKLQARRAAIHYDPDSAA